MVTSRLVLEAVTETCQASGEEHSHGFSCRGAEASSHLAAGDLG